MHIVLAVPRLGERVGAVFKLSEVSAEVRPADRGRADSVGPPKVAGAVDRNRSQPGPEGAGALVVLEVWKSANDDREDILDEVFAVLRLNADADEPTADERGVQIDEPAPGPRVGIAGAGEQAGRGCGHGVPGEVYCEFRAPLGARPSWPKRSQSGRDGRAPRGAINRGPW